MNAELLIIGLGNMGSIHAKYAEQLGVNWHWYDPHLDCWESEIADRRVETLKRDGELHLPYTHIIIASPSSTHADMLMDLSGFNGRILVEKPGVLKAKDITLLHDPHVSVGLVERYNPAWDTLMSHVETDKVLNIDFYRCSARPVSHIKESSFEDVGIHDIDLFTQMFESYNEDRSISCLLKTSNTFILMCQMFNPEEGSIARFIWSNETFYKERRIYVRQTDCNFVCDLIDQTVKKYAVSRDGKNTVTDLYVEKASPVKRQMEAFLGNKPMSSGIESHKMFFDILDRIDWEDEQ